MCSRIVMKNVDKKCVIVNPCAVSKRVWEHFVTHCVSVYSNHLINIYLIPLDLLLCPGIFTKCSQKPHSIIVIKSGKFFSGCILLNFFKFDVRIWSTTKTFFKSQIILLKTILFDVIVAIVFSCYS